MGAVQTPEVKLLSFLVVLLVFAIPFLLQFAWMLINIVVHHKRKTREEEINSKA